MNYVWVYKNRSERPILKHAVHSYSILTLYDPENVLVYNNVCKMLIWYHDGLRNVDTLFCISSVKLSKIWYLLFRKKKPRGLAKFIIVNIFFQKGCTFLGGDNYNTCIHAYYLSLYIVIQFNYHLTPVCLWLSPISAEYRTTLNTDFAKEE